MNCKVCKQCVNKEVITIVIVAVLGCFEWRTRMKKQTSSWTENCRYTQSNREQFKPNNESKQENRLALTIKYYKPWQSVWKNIPNMKMARRVAFIVHVKNLDNEQSKAKQKEKIQTTVNRHTYVHICIRFCNTHTQHHKNGKVNHESFGWNGIRRWIEKCIFFLNFIFFPSLLSKFFINDKKQRITFCSLYIEFFSFVFLLLLFQYNLFAFLIPDRKSRTISEIKNHHQ